jgi:hypothetical protein
MSRILIGILTAHHPSRWWYRVAARQNYLKGSDLDHLFVFGRPPVPDWLVEQQEDEFWVDCDDRKEYMVYKNQALFRYALDHGYTHVLRCCDDTVVFPDRIANAGLESYDVAGTVPCKFSLGGTFKTWFQYLNYFHGGTGIWLSRKAMEMLVADVWDEHRLDSWPEKLDLGFGLQISKPKKYWDDHWISEVLQGNLPYDHPNRKQPMTAYALNGLSVFEDEMLFVNSEPMRALTLHDPGVHKINSREMDEVMEQIKQRNIAMAEAVRAQEAPIA